MNTRSEIFSRVRKEGRKFLLEPEAKTVCRDYGIPVTNFRTAENETEAVEFAKDIGYPVVLKIVSPEIIHKSDVGGVIINLKDSKDVQNAYKQIMDNVQKHKPNAKSQTRR